MARESRMGITRWGAPHDGSRAGEAERGRRRGDDRLSVYAPSRSDCEVCLQVIRLYFWFTAVVEEAKLSMKKLRTLLFGRGPKRPKPSEPASSSVCDSAMGEGEATGDASGQQAAADPSEAVGSTSGSMGSIVMIIEKRHERDAKV